MKGLITVPVSDQWIVADRGGHGFALPLIRVIRVTPSPRICEAPLLPSGYVGVIEFSGRAVPVWDPFPEAGDFMWGATVIIAQTGDDGGLLGLLTDAPPKVETGAEPVAAEELAAAPAPPAADAAEDGEVDWSVGPVKAKPAAAGPPVLPPGPMWDKVVRFAGHPVPVLDPARFSMDSP